MMTKTLRLRHLAADPKLRQFVLYAICGGTGVVTDLAGYSALLFLGVQYQLANVASYAAGTLVSFLLNRHFTFQTYDKAFRRLLLFFATASVGYATSTALLWYLVEMIGTHPFAAKLATLVFVLVLQFTLNRAVTFRAQTSTPTSDE